MEWEFAGQRLACKLLAGWAAMFGPNWETPNKIKGMKPPFALTFSTSAVLW